MRVQHNIASMNSYRNYNNNTRAINKNLEKLSSGYRINRAGDDAAGLAISEKMRAQITGLEGAQKNAKDGISLVQTAEGALTEVHSMLNRMVSLAEQSANGTYNNTTDRAQLQKEVDALKDEINRIADSANFNGLKLLDGSLGGSATSGVAVDFEYPNAGLVDASLVTMQAATKTTIDFALDGTNAGSVAADKDYNLEVVYADKDGTKQSKTLTFTANANGYTDETELAAEIKTQLSDIFNSDDFDFTDNGDGSLTITAKEAGASNKAAIYGLTLTSADDGTVIDVFSDGNGSPVSGATTPFANAAGEDAYYKLDVSKMVGTDGKREYSNGVAFKVNGQSFAFVTADKVKDLSTSNYVVVGDADTSTGWTTPTNTEAKQMAELINKKTGINATVSGTTISFKAAKGTSASGGGTTLQIGDTADSWNQLQVSISDIHASSIGVGGVDISTQDGAKVALNQINDAINYVSDVRGGLGAVQNRLEHTINNLSVMQENMQDAESTIRDTDVADEMMKYTKNSILVQSAQAMLAQANQQPQGVLQLLQ